MRVAEIFGNITSEEQKNLSQVKPSLLYEATKPSTPAELHVHEYRSCQFGTNEGRCYHVPQARQVWRERIYQPAMFSGERQKTAFPRLSQFGTDGGEDKGVTKCDTLGGTQGEQSSRVCDEDK